MAQENSAQTTTANPGSAPVAGAYARIAAVIEPMISPLGYEVVYLEVQNQRQKILRIFIDRLENNSAESGIGIEDCVKVTRALDEPLEGNAEIEGVFKGPYELEVSSPGVDRPLRTERDFTRFIGRQARVHTFRPLNAEEAGNAEYQAKNSKQKNFLGTIVGIDGEPNNRSVALTIARELSKKELREAKRLKQTPPAGERVTVPIELISKAHLEPVFDFSE